MMSAGQWVQQVALGWLVYELTGSSVLLGVLNGLRALPLFDDRADGGSRRRPPGPAATDAAHAVRADCDRVSLCVVVLVMIQSMHMPLTPKEARRSSALANLKEGFAYVRSTRTVLALMILAYIPRVFAVPYQTLMPVFQKDVLQVGPEGLGMLMAAPGLGAVLAVLTIASISNRMKRQGIMLVGSTIMLGLSLILFSRITSFPLALLVLVIVGAFQMVFLASTNTMLQLIIPDELRGRVMSLYMLDRGLMPAGACLPGLSRTSLARR